ncbi:MAG TPA: hypothetical protein VFN74_04500, partial [Chloroflexota bacterium]|nr:hypothetical protein [Chloroflexota bacterium]
SRGHGGRPNCLGFLKIDAIFRRVCSSGAAISSVLSPTSSSQSARCLRKAATSPAIRMGRSVRQNSMSCSGTREAMV